MHLTTKTLSLVCLLTWHRESVGAVGALVRWDARTRKTQCKRLIVVGFYIVVGYVWDYRYGSRTTGFEIASIFIRASHEYSSCKIKRYQGKPAQSYQGGGCDWFYGRYRHDILETSIFCEATFSPYELL
jgi:hypothetical protein